MLEETLKELNKLSDTIATFHDEDTFIKSGSIALDSVLSNGRGIPQKKFIEISGQSSIGKSSLVLHVIKQPLSEGKVVVYLDSEKGVNKSQLDGFGLSEYVGKNLFIYKVNTFEECEQVLDVALKEPELAYVVIDSISFILPKAKIEKSVENNEIGLKARSESGFVQKYKALLEMSPSKASFLFINQLRTKFSGFIATQDAGGSLALQYVMDVRLRMKKDSDINSVVMINGKEVRTKVGARVAIYATKSRYNMPGIQCKLYILFGKGVSNLMSLQDYLTENGYIERPSKIMFQFSSKLGILGSDNEPLKMKGTKELQAGVRDNYERILEALGDIPLYTELDAGNTEGEE